jgi:hypothetical protein
MNRTVLLINYHAQHNRNIQMKNSLYYPFSNCSNNVAPKTIAPDILYGKCSCTMPRLTGHLQPRRNWPTWASNVLITHPIPGSGPVGIPPVPWTEKGRHFSSDAEVIAVAETWLDGHFSDFFLSGLQKLEQRAKKCIELRGEYVE